MAQRIRPQGATRFRDRAIGKRKENSRSQKSLVIIACEGIATEVNYFHGFFRELSAGGKISNSSCVIATHRHTDPRGVLQDLLDYRTEFGAKYSDFDEKWIVIDRDPERTNGGGHTLENFNAAIEAARQNQISVAWSNPCFELWILLHFEFRNTSIDRDDFSRLLSDARRLNREYNKNIDNLYELLQTKQVDAIRNAKRLSSENHSVQPASSNPGTMIFSLLESVRNSLEETEDDS